MIFSIDYRPHPLNKIPRSATAHMGYRLVANEKIVSYMDRDIIYAHTHKKIVRYVDHEVNYAHIQVVEWYLMKKL